MGRLEAGFLRYCLTPPLGRLESLRVSLARNAGAWILESAETSGYGLVKLWESLLEARALGTRRKEFSYQLYRAGIETLPVIIVVAVFTGMILSAQTGVQLAKYQQAGQVGTLISITMCREMGPFMTAIILAACVGSAMAAEIGTMRVSEEIDALEVMSIHPVRFLLMPRILALTLICPILTILTNLLGIAGGSLVARFQLGVTFHEYYTNALDVLKLKDPYSGLVKAIVFGMTIATVGCTMGMRTTGGAIGVGRATLNSVVISLLLILILGYFMTWMFYVA